MNLLTNDNPLVLWQETIKTAEERCDVKLNHELESYLISLLNDYTNKPEITRQIFAMSLLNAHQAEDQIRHHSFQQVGDHCLIYAGLFPQAANKKLVKISYFVDMGRSAYISISNGTNDLFKLLSLQFVILMDVLQCIRPHPGLLPIEAFEQWSEVGSQRAFRILTEYAQHRGLPKF